MIEVAFYIAGLIILVTIILCVFAAALPVMVYLPFAVVKKWREIPVPKQKVSRSLTPAEKRKAYVLSLIIIGLYSLLFLLWYLYS